MRSQEPAIAADDQRLYSVLIQHCHVLLLFSCIQYEVIDKHNEANYVIADAA
jgi:hypothetical protein